jgi:hypothetical protein
VTRRCALRCSLFALLCVLLGALTTVAVAWGIEWCLFEGGAPYPPPVTNLEGEAAVAAGWPIGVPRDWPAPNNIVRWEYGGSRVDRAYFLADYTPGTGGSWAVLHRAWAKHTGWPSLAVGCELYAFNGAFLPSGQWVFPSWRLGLVRASPPGRGRPPYLQLPSLPLWPGFALDAGIYSGAWGLVLFMVLSLGRAGKRRMRIARGRCAACGYDLRGLAGGVCPECGRTAGVKP